MPFADKKGSKGMVRVLTEASMVMVFEIYSCDGLLAYYTVCQLSTCIGVLVNMYGPVVFGILDPARRIFYF
ncbi:hypothetical protein QBC32DRAFT_309835 [Pseudoneurospora amorphoporcata]|uniref:Uncharacterized protein n=1 Tax=Pseudoneurospora amorphoporcata TaxID=241081 RepID=A0AAN6P2Z1_9PEZI|nr:hypothetical protein QBC32DRAFT_309835 [Pseudoneurospora amorphoporcata]